MLSWFTFFTHKVVVYPEGGENGGYIVATGTPEEIIACDKSYTAQYLKEKISQE